MRLIELDELVGFRSWFGKPGDLAKPVELNRLVDPVRPSMSGVPIKRGGLGCRLS